MTALTEWRVTWRRVGWAETSESKSRHLQRRADVERFLLKLRRHAPGVTAVEWIRVDVREVGPWRPM